MKTLFPLLTLSLILSFSACKQQSKSDKEFVETTADTTEYIPKSWIDKRVEKAKSRLESTEAGTVIWKAMEAHGGLEKWYTDSPLSFRFNYQPLDGSTQRDSYQTIDTYRNRAKHYSASDSTATFGWTGEKAWMKAKDSTAFAYDTKFWALTPYYFLGQPFVLDGSGVNLELLPQTNYKDKLQDVVKVTFAAGTGDAPDDYYVLYFENDTHQLNVIRYIVSYPEYFKDGGHSPEKFMEVLGHKMVDGILLPTSYKTHWLADDNQPGEYITKIEVSAIDFRGTVPDNFFAVPKGAKVFE